MGYFKIRNITSLLGKRHPKVNSTQKIDVSGQFSKNNINLNPDSEFVLEANFLPISVHKLRSEGLISVLDISKDEYLAAVNDNTVKNTPVQSTETKGVSSVTEKKTVVTEKKRVGTASHEK